MEAKRSSNQVRSRGTGRGDADRRLNVVYWMRIAAGIAAGLLSGYLWRIPALSAASSLMPVVVFVASIGAAKAIMGRVRSNKIYYHGIGGYIIWWFVTFAAYLSLMARV